MLKVDEAVIVEGRYDKLKLANIIDALIIETNGFSIFNDKEKMNFIKRLADERGLIVITDSDSGGFQIRRYISSGIDKEKIKHIYIPDVYGKEKRKKAPSKQGKLGVEGMDESVLLSLFKKADISVSTSKRLDPLTSYDFYFLKLSGTSNAKENKKKLLKSLNLPEFLSTSSLISYINSIMEKQEFYDYCEKLLDISEN